MILIVGLGNVGDKYDDSRHNVGFEVANRLQSMDHGKEEWEENKKFQAIVCKLEAIDVLLAKPTTFMNSSGDAVSALAAYYKLPATNIWVVHDDLDIRLGQYKIQFSVGPKVHGGINSIEEKLGTKDFWRVRIGVDNREKIRNSNIEIRNKFKIQNSKNQNISGDEYVMGKFEKDEVLQVEQVVEKVVRDLKVKLSV